MISLKPELELEYVEVRRVAPSVIPGSGTGPSLTKGEVMVGGCSGGKIRSPPNLPKRIGGSCFNTSLGDFHFIMTS